MYLFIYPIDLIYIIYLVYLSIDLSIYLSIYLPGEPFDHKKRAHTALVHEKIFSRPYAVFTAIRIVPSTISRFSRFSTAIQRFSTAKCTLFHGQILFSRPYFDSKAKPFFRSHLAKRPLASFFAIKRPPRYPI